MSVYLKTPFKRRWLFATLVVFIIALGMIGLGLRQLALHRERQAYIQAVVAEVNDTPFYLTGAAEDDAYQERVYHLVEADGHFDFDHQVLIKGKFYQDTLGYHVMTPFLLQDSDRAVLVDRGWIPPEGIQTPEDVRPFDEPEITHIVARIAPTATHADSRSEPQTSSFFWYWEDVQGIAAQLPYPTLPYYVAMIPPEEGQQSAPPYRDPPKFKLDPGPHYGNAVGWFVLTLLLFPLYAWLVVRADQAENS